MRILLAYDGSPGSQQAIALVESLSWPPGSSVRVVLVVEPAYSTLGPSAVPGSLIPSPVLDEEFMAIQRELVEETAQKLARDDRSTEGAVILGRAATVLVDEAARYRADVVVMGSRGHGPIVSLVLGSVSAEVIDYAPCPVLVARTPTVTRVLLASDGSAASAAANEVIRSWRIFERTPIRVVSVAEVPMPWQAGIAPMMRARAAAAFADDVETARAHHQRLAEDVAVTIRGAGRSAESSLRSGDAAGEIVAAAAEWDADLVVVGSRGQTGLTRLLLGSVARNVLHGTRASVLVVHAPSAATTQT